MKKLKFLPIFLIICLLTGLFAGTFAVADGPEISAPSAVLLDAATGEVLFEKDADRQVYPASTTKIMTVLLAVEAVERGEIALDETVAGSSSITYDLSSLGSTAGISVGEKLTFEDLLYCAMLSSANEACNIIAERVSGIIYDFIQSMNARAKELGCTATNFVNTHGLQSSLHYTTARDYSLIAMEAMRHPLFMKLCGTAQHIVPATNYWGERTLKNSNALLCADGMYGSGYLYDGCTGMKTGHTSYAGYCLVSSAHRNGGDLLCLLYGDDSSDACFRDSAVLLDWGFSTHAPTPLTYLADASSAEPEWLSLSADSFEADIGSAAAVVLNQEDGALFYAKNALQPVYPADLTKLMTALLAAEAIEDGLFSLSSEVTVTDAAFADLTDGCTRLLYSGETLPMESLLYCALLPSADDACNAIAEYVGGSIDLFVQQMNRRAAELGCVSTGFVNPHGLYDENQYTTAADYALIALEASRHDLLMRICATEAAELPETNKSPSRTVKSTNALLSDNSSYGSGYVFDKATGLKTGYNSAAGFCLAASAQDGASGISLVSVVFGGQKSNGRISSFSDTVQLYSYIFENYSYQEILRSTENIASVDIALGSDSDYVNLHPANSITLLLPKDYDRSEFQMQLRVYSIENGEMLTAPIKAGEVLGEVSVLRDGRNYGTVKLVASSNVELSRAQYLQSSISETLHSTRFKLIFWITVLLLGAYLLWVIVYRIRHMKHRLALREAENAKAQAAELAAAPGSDPKIEFFSSDVPPAPKTVPLTEDRRVTVFPAAKPASKPVSAPQPAPVPTAASAHAAAPTPVPTAQDPAPAASKPVSAGLSAQDLSILQDEAERDYFEEFFRKK